MELILLVLSFVVLWFIIRSAIDGSEMARDIAEIKRLLAEKEKDAIEKN